MFEEQGWAEPKQEGAARRSGSPTPPGVLVAGLANGRLSAAITRSERLLGLGGAVIHHQIGSSVQPRMSSCLR